MQSGRIFTFPTYHCQGARMNGTHAKSEVQKVKCWVAGLFPVRLRNWDRLRSWPSPGGHKPGSRADVCYAAQSKFSPSFVPHFGRAKIHFSIAPMSPHIVLPPCPLISSSCLKSTDRLQIRLFSKSILSLWTDSIPRPSNQPADDFTTQ